MNRIFGKALHELIGTIAHLGMVAGDQRTADRAMLAVLPIEGSHLSLKCGPFVQLLERLLNGGVRIERLHEPDLAQASDGFHADDSPGQIRLAGSLGFFRFNSFMRGLVAFPDLLANDTKQIRRFGLSVLADEGDKQGDGEQPGGGCGSHDLSLHGLRSRHPFG